MKTRSFLQWQPYWTTLRIDVGSGREVAVLVLKDGSIAVGMRAEEMCLEAATNEQLNRHAAALEKALNSLPGGAYVQSVFETGGDYQEVLDLFARQGAPQAHPLLSHGRRLRAALLREMHQDEVITRCRVTYWVGWRGAFADIGIQAGATTKILSELRRLVGSGLGVDVTRVRRAGRFVFDAADRFAQIAHETGLRLCFLDEAEILAACHHALNPRSGKHLAPRPLSGKPTLEAVSCNHTLLAVGDPPLLMRAIGVTDLPSGTTPASLYPAMFDHMPHRPFRLVCTHVATDRLAVAKKFKRQLRHTLAHMRSDYDAAESHDDTEAALTDQARGSSSFETRMVATVQGENEDELDRATTAMINGLRASNIAAATCLNEQLTAWSGALPAWGYKAPRVGPLHGRNSAHLMPYWVPMLGNQAPEILLNNRMRGLNALTVRPGGHREHAGAFIAGSLGSGKTHLLTHLLKYGCLDLGGYAVVVDNKGPENSTFRPQCELYGGRYISLDQNDNVSFNPVPTREEVFNNPDPKLKPADLIEPLVQVVCMMAAPKATAEDDRVFFQNVARDVINLTYEANSANSEPLTLSHVIRSFDGYAPVGVGDMTRSAAPVLRERLKAWLDAPRRANLFDRPAHADFSNKFTVFDFFGMDSDPEASAVLVSVLCDRIVQLLTRIGREVPKMFAFDEAWQMFKNDAACALLDRLYRITRSYNGFCVASTQGVEDMLQSPAATGMSLNTSIYYLMPHLDRHEEVARALSLTSAEMDLFKSLQMRPGEYGEFLLIDKGANKGGAGHRAHVLQYRPTPFDLWCDTSRPRDVALRDQRVKESKMPIQQVIQQLAAEYPRGVA